MAHTSVQGLSLPLLTSVLTTPSWQRIGVVEGISASRSEGALGGLGAG